MAKGKKKDGPNSPKKTPRPQIKSPTIGDKSRAGRLLSEYLRRIAQEETELTEGTALESGTLITKAEAIARLMFKLALGYKEINKAGDKDIIHGPDRGMIALIWDRIEGRATPINDNLAKRRTLPKKVSDENKRRMNELATGNDETTG